MSRSTRSRTSLRQGPSVNAIAKCQNSQTVMAACCTSRRAGMGRVLHQHCRAAVQMVQMVEAAMTHKPDKALMCMHHGTD
jgi:hypothetical protein